MKKIIEVEFKYALNGDNYYVLRDKVYDQRAKIVLRHDSTGDAIRISEIIQEFAETERALSKGCDSYVVSEFLSVKDLKTFYNNYQR